MRNILILFKMPWLEALYGTAARAIMKDLVIAGKTGTAQNPHGEDHSVFIAFAPKDNPKIAIAVYVENAGWGGRAAASTASLMIEKYLRGDYFSSRTSGICFSRKLYLLMREADIQINRVDWITVSIYFTLVIIGWFNIYAAVYDSQIERSIFDVSINSGIQLVWIGTALIIITLIMVADPAFLKIYLSLFT